MSLSDTEELESVLQRPDPKQSCDLVIAYLQAVADRREDERSCYSHFHKICARIFGFEESKSWLEEAQYNEGLSNSVMTLLKPDGPLFYLIFTIYIHNVNYKFEFPLKKIPFLILKRIESGNFDPIPQFFYNKLKEATTHDIISLNMFEYYIFCFASFILDPKKRLILQASTKSSFSPNRLLQKLTSPTKDPTRKLKTEIKYPVRLLLEKYLRQFFPISPEYIKSRLNASASVMPYDEPVQSSIANKIATYLQSSDYSIIFETILLHFWLDEYYELDSIQYEIASPVFQQYGDYIIHQFHPNFVKTCDRVLYSTKIVIRHLFKIEPIRNWASREYSFNSILQQRGNFAPTVPKQLLVVLNPLFNFLRAVFDAWHTTASNDDYPAISMTRVLDLWETYIHPWNIWQGHATMGEKKSWIPFIMLNWCFYSDLMVDFLTMAKLNNLVQLMVTANKYDELKAFSDFLTKFDFLYEGLLSSYIDKVDKCASEARSGNISTFRYNNFLIEYIDKIVGLSNYQSLNSQSARDSAQAIMDQCLVIYADCTVKKESTILHFGTQKDSDSYNIINSFKEIIGLQDRESFDGHHMEISANNKQVVEKCTREIYVAIGKIMGLGDSKFLEDKLKNQAQQWKQQQVQIQFGSARQLQNLSYQRGYPGELANQPLRNSFLYPEVDPHTNKLTTMGKQQIMNGVRKCQPGHVRYFGDPMYRMPIGDWEIEWLVNLAVSVSERINYWIDTNIYGETNVPPIPHRRNRTKEYVVQMLTRQIDKLKDTLQNDRFSSLQSVINAALSALHWVKTLLISINNAIPHSWREGVKKLGISLLLFLELVEYYPTRTSTMAGNQDDRTYNSPRLRVNLRKLADVRHWCQHLLWRYLLFFLVVYMVFALFKLLLIR